jgi:hypothetical protein
MLPNYLIVGAPKCGTSSLARWLEQHPQVYMVPEKELHFFTGYWEQGLDWYEACFQPNGEPLVGEASPAYLANHTAHERMASIVPDAKLIAMVRNPVDRAYSHYWHWHDRKGEKRSFEEVIAPELAGTDDLYLAPGRYLEHIEALLEHYPREQLDVIVFDDLAAKPTEVFQAACRFLGADDTIVPDNVGSVVNSYMYYYPRWLWAIFVKVRIGKFLPGRVGAALYRKMVRTADPYPPMDANTRARLIEYFRPHNDALSAWLGRDLSHWR